MVIEPVIKLNQHEFCPNQAFMDEVINILDTHLFCNEAVRLREAYKWMASQLNEPNVSGKDMILPMDNPKVFLPQKSDISKDGEIWAGHDLPVWLGCPCVADVKLMIVSQDPRRNDAEMGGCQIPSIGLSTPFGLHNAKWRRHRLRGLPHYLAQELMEEFCGQDKRLSVYYTDFDKLRRVEAPRKKTGKAANDKVSLSCEMSPAKIDTNNEDKYREIFFCEVKKFQPHVVLLMGGKARALKAELERRGILAVDIPHPNARPDTWKNRFPKIKGYKACDKVECIVDALKQFDIFKNQ